MFFSKCKKCGGRKVPVSAELAIEIDGAIRNVQNIPAKQCVQCGDIVISDFVLERLRQYACDHPSDPLDYGRCEDEESAGAQILF